MRDVDNSVLPLSRLSRILGETMNDNLMAAFQECNSHMRTTEQKHLTVTVAYLGSIGVAIPLVVSSLSNSPALQIQRGVSLFVISLVGIVVHGLQRWYALWKSHYLRVLKNQSKLLFEQAGANSIHLPLFLREADESEERVTGSIDQIIDFVTLFLAASVGCLSLYFGTTGVLHLEPTTERWPLVGHHLPAVLGWTLIGIQSASLAFFHLALRWHLSVRRKILDRVMA